MNEGNHNNWPTIEPANLDQLIKYKRGELSDQEAHKVELFLSEFDADLLDGISLDDLEKLRDVEVRRPVNAKRGLSPLRIAAGIAALVGILALTYVLTQDKLAGDDIVMHEATDEVVKDVEDDTHTEAVVEEESPTETVSDHQEESTEDVAPQENIDIESDEVVGHTPAVNPDIENDNESKKDKSTDNSNNLKLSDNNEDALTEETEAISAAKYKIAEKDAVVKTEAPVVYTIIEKYNNPKDKPADVPKTARAFAKSTVGVSKNTYRRKVSPSFPGGDVALIKWFEDNYTELIKEGDQPFKLTFKVTKKAKLVDAVFTDIDKNKTPAFSKKLKEMPDWNKPESNYDPLDIYYSIWIAPKQ